MPKEMEHATLSSTFMIYAFIKNSFWIPTQGVANGSSWLELCTTFYIAGGRTLDEDLTHPGYYEVGRLLESYRAFNRSLLQIVHTWMEPDYRFMFSPARVGETRLGVYGISSHVPCIKAERVVNSDMANELHKALSSLTTAWTKKGVEKVETGVLKAQPKKMKWAGRIPWHQWCKQEEACQTLPCHAQKYLKEALEAQEKQQELKLQEGKVGTMLAAQCKNTQALHVWTSFVVACPTCRARKEVGRTNLRRKAVWCRVSCKRCGHIHKASRWVCTCEKAWIGCSKHFQDGLKCHNPHSNTCKKGNPFERKGKSKEGKPNPRRGVGALGDKDEMVRPRGASTRGVKRRFLKLAGALELGTVRKQRRAAWLPKLQDQGSLTVARASTLKSASGHD